jgi:hypothetical protein
MITRLFIHVFGYCLAGQVLSQTTVPVAAPLPALNQHIVEFTKAHMGQRVDRGECWDLAAFALNDAGAEWDGKLNFGRLIDPAREVVFPGDIIQLEGVEFKWTENGATNVITMPHHTAIVYEVISRGVFKVAQQNMEGIGRKVGLGQLTLKHRVKGTIRIHRPVAK